MRTVWGGCVAVACLGLLACDGSRAELEQTKGQLQAVTAERDALKGQVSAMQQQLDAANARLAAAQSGTPAVGQAPAGRDTRGSRTSSSAQPQPGSQEKQTRETQQEKAQHEMTGRSSMNN